MSTGAMLGPIIGGALNDRYGYRTTSDIVACFSGTCAILYLLLNMSLSDFKLQGAVPMEYVQLKTLPSNSSPFVVDNSEQLKSFLPD